MAQDATVQYLDQLKVTRYAKLNALIRKWAKEAEVLNKILKEGLKAGSLCPKSGPWLVVLTPTSQTSVSWKEEWENLAKVVDWFRCTTCKQVYTGKTDYCPDCRADKKAHKIQPTNWAEVQANIVASNKVPSHNLNVQANPDYKAEPKSVAGLADRPAVRRAAR